MKRVRLLCLLLCCALVLAGLGDRPPSAEAQTASLTGLLLIRTGSPQPGATNQTPQRLFHLMDDQGKAIQIVLSEKADLQAAVSALNGRRVVVDIVAAPSAGPAGQGPVEVRSIRPEKPVSSPSASVQSQQSAAPPQTPPASSLTGPLRWVTIPCRFADSTGITPRTKSWFEGLMGTASPGMQHYWQTSSYGAVDFSGSLVTNWYNLPQPRSYYIGLQNANLETLFTDCTGAADADVNFQNFEGINLMFNRDLDCCAWSGPFVSNRDSVTKTYMTTWLPAWAYANHEVVGREMGHAMGLPHSSGPYTSTFDSAWDVMSKGGLCQVPHSQYGCVAADTISYHKDLLGWMPAGKKYVPAAFSTQTITIDHLGLPGGPGYLMAQIPIGGSSTHFYTVEVRKKTGYDVETPGNAVIIHEVDTARLDRQAQVIDSDGNGNPNDAGAMWLSGETFQVDLYGVQVQVLSESATSFQVKITTGASSPPMPNDDFNNATVISVLPFFDTQNAFLASSASDDPATSCGDPSFPKNANSVWYQYTPASAIQVAVNTQGSTYDTVLAVWTGPRGSLTEVACNDNVSGTDATSSLNFAAVGGVTYYIEAMDYGAAGGGTLHLSVNPPAGALSGPPWWFPWYDDQGMVTKVFVGNGTSDRTIRCNVFIGLISGSLALRGTYAMNPGEVIIHENDDLIDGPVKVQCDQPVITSEQAFYGTSFNEVAGIPQAQLGAEWWFPWYDGQGMITWVLIGNASDTLVASCQVYIGKDGTGALIPRGPVTVQPRSRQTPQYDGVITGPVKVLCDNPVYVTERALYSTSFNEVLGIPPSAFNEVQWFPWYDNSGMVTWVHLGNPSPSQLATCDVYIGVDAGGALVLRGTFNIPPNSSQPPQFPGLIDGPVKVDCNRPIYASERAIYRNSFNEVMGIPETQLGMEWWFPWYENAGMVMWVLLGNPSPSETATCAVSIGGVPKGNQVIGPNSRVIPQYAGLSDGPVKITCDKAVYATERAIYQTSFSEMVGLQPQ